jgi:glycosyltransferase involved in cell wall biosynthesis
VTGGLTALKVRGPFRGPSGYDHHVREFVRELHEQGVAVELVDMPEWGPARLPERLRDPWFDSLDTPTGARVVLHFCMPHQVISEAGRVNVNYTMFEATRVPPAWVAHNRAHDLVIVPTESSRRAWIGGGMPAERIRLCPLGINPTLFSGSLAPLPLRRANGERLDRYRVRLLNVSELGPRKNLVGLLRVWLRATTRVDDAVLVIKLGCFQPGFVDVFAQRLRRLQEQLGKRFDQAAPVHIVSELFSDADMPRLYAAATHYISLSFGEGWDQAMVEAAASGLRLIAPDHSAYSAYLDSSVARLIPSREVPAVFRAGDGSGVLFEGASWWEPDEGEAIAAIRAAIDGRDGGTASARPRILGRFTWEDATRRLIAILGEAEATGTRRGFWPPLRWYRHG